MTAGRGLDRFASVFASNRAFGSNVSVVMRVTGRIDPAWLREALDELQRRHEALRVRLEVRAGETAYAPGSPPLSLRVVHAAGGNDDETPGRTALEDELQAPFDLRRGPLARWVAVIPEKEEGATDLVLCGQHSIVDAMTGSKWLRDLLTACAQRAQGLPASLPGEVALRTIRDDELPEAVRGWRGRLRFIVYVARLLARECAIRALRFARDDTPVERRRTIVAWRPLSAADTAALEALCIEKDTSVHALTLACLLIAAARRLSPGKPAWLSSATMVNIRQWVEPKVSPESSGCYVAGIGHTHRISPGHEPWELARGISAKLKRSISRHEQLLTPLLVPYEVARKAAQGRRTSWTVMATTSGRLRIPLEYGPFRILAISGAASMNRFGAGCLSTCTQVADRLFWTLSFVEPELDRAEAEAFASSAMAVLEEALASPKGNP